MKISRYKSLLILVLVVLFSFAGCSSDDADSASQPDSSTPSAAESNDDSSTQQAVQEPESTDDSNQGNIDQARAEEIALAHAKLDRSAVSSLNSKLDNNNGIMVFEVKFLYNGKEYEYKIHAQTGEIVEAENED